MCYDNNEGIKILCKHLLIDKYHICKWGVVGSAYLDIAYVS